MALQPVGRGLQTGSEHVCPAGPVAADEGGVPAPPPGPEDGSVPAHQWPRLSPALGGRQQTLLLSAWNRPPLPQPQSCLLFLILRSESLSQLCSLSLSFSPTFVLRISFSVSLYNLSFSLSVSLSVCLSLSPSLPLSQATPQRQPRFNLETVYLDAPPTGHTPTTMDPVYNHGHQIRESLLHLRRSFENRDLLGKVHYMYMNVFYMYMYVYTIISCTCTVHVEHYKKKWEKDIHVHVQYKCLQLSFVQR